MLRWGLVPSWSKESKTKHLLINARAEGIEAKPVLLPRPCAPPSLHRPGQRVLYEWGRQDTGKQPYFVRPTGDEVFALAGIWDQWEGKQGEVIESVAIITTSANELMQPIHDRMPLILGEGNVAEWIEPQTVIDKALAMLKPFPSEMMVAR